MIQQKVLFNKSEVDAILDWTNKKEFITSQVYTNGEEVTNKTYRNTTETSIKARGKVYNLLFGKFNTFGAVSLPFSVNILKYEEGSFFKKHTDATYSENSQTKERYKSLIVQLSDSTDYTGGDVYLYKEGQKIEFSKELGNTILFNSDILHEVTPITSGIRHSLVCWFTYSNFNPEISLL